MPLLDLPADRFKKFRIQLPSRVLEGVAAKEKIFLDPDGRTRIFMHQFKPKDVFFVRFNAVAIRDEDEATAIIGLLLKSYVREIKIESLANGGEIVLSRDHAHVLPPASIIGQFYVLKVECNMDSWGRCYLNSAQWSIPSETVQTLLPGLFLVGFLAVGTVLTLLLPYVSPWFYICGLLFLLGMLYSLMMNDFIDDLIKPKKQPNAQPDGASSSTAVAT